MNALLNNNQLNTLDDFATLETLVNEYIGNNQIGNINETDEAELILDVTHYIAMHNLQHNDQVFAQVIAELGNQETINELKADNEALYNRIDVLDKRLEASQKGLRQVLAVVNQFTQA